jgi:hypothetical protein
MEEEEEVEQITKVEETEKVNIIAVASAKTIILCSSSSRDKQTKEAN